VEITPSHKPVYNIPTISGRLFDGDNFAPVSGVKIELYHNGTLVAMKDRNWQNPIYMVSNTEGSYSFWPVPIHAEKADENSIFEYTLKVVGDEYETLTHVFRIPVGSELQTSKSFTLERTFKLPDLFIFPPGEDEYNRSLDE
jgi:competence protein ComFB